MTALAEWTTTRGGNVSGLLADRPTAPAFGIGFYYATDDNAGTLYRSDGAGWTRVSPKARLLGEATRNTDFVSSATNLDEDVVGLSKVVTVEDKPARATFHCPRGISTDGAGGYSTVTVFRDATAIIFTALKSTAANDPVPVALRGPVEVLAPGNFTYKVTMRGGWLGTGGGAAKGKLQGGDNQKMVLSIEEAPNVG